VQKEAMNTSKQHSIDIKEYLHQGSVEIPNQELSLSSQGNTFQLQ